MDNQYGSNGTTNPDTHTDAVLKHGRALRTDAQALAGELRGAAAEIQDKLDLAGRLERNPYGTLLVAAGVGYVLGGGLFSRFTGTALKLGVRLMLVPMIKNELMALSEAAVEGVQSDR